MKPSGGGFDSGWRPMNICGGRVKAKVFFSIFFFVFYLFILFFLAVAAFGLNDICRFFFKISYNNAYISVN